MANLLASLIGFLTGARRTPATLQADAAAVAVPAGADVAVGADVVDVAATAPEAAAPNEAAPEAAPAVAGWFGKIPTLGDFASRRLPESFTTRWDAWLSAGIEAAEATLGTDWPDVFRRRPPWRFLLAADVIDAQVWVGVMVASADKVGRPFPLTVALPCGPATLAALEPWWQEAARAVIDCQAQNATVDVLDDALTRLGVPASVPPVVDNDAGVVARLPAQHGLGAALGHAPLFVLPALRGLSLWWPCAEDAEVVLVRGLPDAPAFARLLDGSL